jgi:predicted lysophospholipase L1 biosynthesis ABC-type transport system permease subunit
VTEAERKAGRKLAVRQRLASHGTSLEPLPPYEETPLSIVGEAARSARRSAIPAQVAGGIVTIVIGIVLYIVSVNGVVITLTATISGVLAGSLVARGLELHWRRRSQRSLRVNSTPIALLAVSRTAKPGHRSSSRKRIRTLR